MPYKVFSAGEEALASDANQYLMSQTVPRFTNAAQRTSQLTAPVLNQLSILDTRPGVVQFWSGSAWVDQGSSELYFNEITSPVSITATTAASAQLVAGAGSFTFDGLPVEIAFSCPYMQTGAPAGAAIALSLWDATDLGILAHETTPITGSTSSAPVMCRRRLTPSPGAHTYSIRGWLPAGTTGSVGAGPGGVGAYVPAIMSVRRLA